MRVSIWDILRQFLDLIDFVKKNLRSRIVLGTFCSNKLCYILLMIFYLRQNTDFRLVSKALFWGKCRRTFEWIEKKSSVHLELFIQWNRPLVWQYYLIYIYNQVIANLFSSLWLGSKKSSDWSRVLLRTFSDPMSELGV